MPDSIDILLERSVEVFGYLLKCAQICADQSEGGLERI